MTDAINAIERILQAADYTGLGNTHAVVELSLLNKILETLKAQSGAASFEVVDAEASQFLSEKGLIRMDACLFEGDPGSSAVFGNWNPISTVPKDGSRVLLGYEGAADYDIAWWSAEFSEWIDSYSDLLPVAPTHWKTLSPP